MFVIFSKTNVRTANNCDRVEFLDGYTCPRSKLRKRVYSLIYTLKAIVACSIGRSLDLSVCDANDTMVGWFSAFIPREQDPRARWRNWVTVPSTVTRFAAPEWHKIEQEIGPRPTRTIRTATMVVGPSWTLPRWTRPRPCYELLNPSSDFTFRGKRAIASLPCR